MKIRKIPLHPPLSKGERGGFQAEKNMADPQTPEQWQHAVDLAYSYLLFDSARQYGLVTGGPTVRTKRCEEILQAGRARGISPAPASIDRCIDSILKNVRSAASG